MPSHDQVDAFLELMPNSDTMRTQVFGESRDAKKSRSDEIGEGAIEIDSFSFGTANASGASIKKKKKAKKKAKKKTSKKKGKQVDEDEEEEDDDEDEDDDEPPQMDRFRFQITKRVERSSPALMQAYFSNSNKRKRAEFNDFDQAKVSFRKVGSSGGQPKTYLTIRFAAVYITGYDLETDGMDPAIETIEFCFQACEMKYKPQTKIGDLEVANIKGWVFSSDTE